MNSALSAASASADVPASTEGEPASWRLAALAALRERDPVAKADAVRALHAQSQAQAAAPRWEPQRVISTPTGLPGRPAEPPLVEPRELQRRSMSTPQGRVVLLHALAHIEFNAINLALDAVWRFPAMPEAFYADWLKVAAEEAYHFSLLRARLADYGHAYGDFPAHNGLWEMCERTGTDVLARMALVPRVLEARGLDASPPIRARLKQAGDDESAAILDIILRDEVGHVRIGNHWFRRLCEARALDPHAAWLALAQQYHAPRMRGPFNFEARRSAGFDEAELDTLAAQDAAEQTASKQSTGRQSHE
ncbi:ferritin-like domain-containing protein [Paraburkholderia sp. CNPSo 3272]|uniref:ferritin-like domain-containing protein n=1 Tax=Paraburkholderia sp. CNPSo 3272 TaxID=2940931 RepID=UPI0020B901DC|nr:ferritin-like domain-containing protein [Paraburkholderia sp. CNPSo 3272]MCP3722808.1 ferritin-like domain-containing protein [Paraburkholderia sp. CNPSo 3272]